MVYNFKNLMLFILQLFFDLIYMSICVCVNRTIDGDLHVVLDGSSFWADWHHFSLYSTHHSSLPEKEHNSIIMTTMQKKISEPNLM